MLSATLKKQDIVEAIVEPVTIIYIPHSPSTEYVRKVSEPDSLYATGDAIIKYSEYVYGGCIVQRTYMGCVRLPDIDAFTEPHFAVSKKYVDSKFAVVRLI